MFSTQSQNRVRKVSPMSVSTPSGPTNRVVRGPGSKRLPSRARPTDGVLQFQLVPLSDLNGDLHRIRRSGSPALLDGLRQSIMAHGILEPLIARRASVGLELICGHRRYAAAKLAGLEVVPVIIREIPDREVMLVALHENLHRDGMTPIEEAEVYRALLRSGTSKSQTELARMVGVSQGRISQMLALLALPSEVQDLLAEPAAGSRGELTEPHTRLLRKLESPARQVELAREVVEKGLTVEMLKQKVDLAPENRKKPAVHERRFARRLMWQELENSRFRRTSTGLRVEINGSSPDELIKELQLLLSRLRDENEVQSVLAPTSAFRALTRGSHHTQSRNSDHQPGTDSR